MLAELACSLSPQNKPVPKRSIGVICSAPFNPRLRTSVLISTQNTFKTQICSITEDVYVSVLQSVFNSLKTGIKNIKQMFKVFLIRPSVGICKAAWIPTVAFMEFFVCFIVQNTCGPAVLLSAAMTHISF